MNEDTFNISIRKFLKMVGVKSQHEIEQAVVRALAEKKIDGKASFPARMQLRIDEIDLDITFDGEIRLE